MSRLVMLILAFVVVAACAQPAARTRPPADTATPTTAPSAVPADGLTIAVGEGAVTVAVREQLASLPAPNDALLTTDRISGQATLKDDGTFTEGSRLEVDLDSLRSDSGTRDSYVKRTTLRTSQFPSATFVPTRVEGLALPVANGPLAFTLHGRMTISGVTRDVRWAVTGRRTDGAISIEATNAPAWKFGDFGLEIPRVFSVVSIVDEIRLTVKLTGTVRETASR